MKINRKNKVYYNKNGENYIIFNNKRYYLNDLQYDKKENTIYICLTNCLRLFTL